jgi:hypothetical protein
MHKSKIDPEEKGVESDVFSESPLPEEVQQLILGYRKRTRKSVLKGLKTSLKETTWLL